LKATFRQNIVQLKQTKNAATTQSERTIPRKKCLTLNLTLNPRNRRVERRAYSPQAGRCEGVAELYGEVRGRKKR
jgi:hypothetical protein